MDEIREGEQEAGSALLQAVVVFVFGLIAIAVPWTFGLDKLTFTIAMFFGSMTLCAIGEGMIGIGFSFKRLLGYGVFFAVFVAAILKYVV